VRVTVWLWPPARRTLVVSSDAQFDSSSSIERSMGTGGGALSVLVTRSENWMVPGGTSACVEGPWWAIETPATRMTLAPSANSLDAAIR